MVFPRATRRLRRILPAACAVAGGALAQPVGIPNGSFESPPTPFVNTHIDAWQKTPKPAAYDESGGFLWEQLTGVFANTPVGAGDHIDNCEGLQAVYLFAVPEVGLLQDYVTMDGNDAEPTHAFDAVWRTGTAYQLDFGIIGGGGNMREGVTLEAAVYFRDAAGRPVTVASTNLIFTREVFPTRTHFSEIRLLIPPVKAADLWAGQRIGIRLLSTVGPAIQGGYWDLDNVRLTAVVPPKFAVTAASDGANLRLTWPSARGYRYQVQRSGDLGNWSSEGPAQDGTGGELSAGFSRAGLPRVYFRVTAAAL